MPIQAPQWTDYLNCPVCCREFGAPARSPISLACGHTLCKHCLKHLHRKQCPFDQTTIQAEPEELVVNTALLQLAGYAPPAQPYHPPCIQELPAADRQAYDNIVRCMEQLAVYLKFCGNANNSITGNRLSRPMQRKLVSLLQCAVTDEEGRGRAARAARALGERTVIELILQHQNSQQLSANLWAAVRARGCQFLGPAMQEEVLKLVLLALEDGSALSRKVLVMFVVQRLEPHFPQASKTSIGHVVQLLYRASCFKVSKRECDSSLMQLKEEFRSYESLRREHDAQIVQIATEAGLRIAPDQWSSLLYGDIAHKSHMQSIIDKLQTPQSFTQSVQELFVALQRTGDPTQLLVMSTNLETLACIDVNPEARSPSWQRLSETMSSVRDVVGRLVHFQQNTGRDANHNQKNNHDRSNEPSTSQPSPANMITPTHNKYKATGRESNRVYNPRGVAKNYARSDENLERYRTAMNNSNSNSTVAVPNSAPLNGNYQFVPPMAGPKMPVPVMIDPMYTGPYKFTVPPPPLNQVALSPAGMPPYMLPQEFPPDNSHVVDNNFALVRQVPVNQNGMLILDRYYGRYGPGLEEAMYAPRTSPYPTEYPPRSSPYPQEFRSQSPPYPQEFRSQSPQYPPEFRSQSPQYPPEFRPLTPQYNQRTQSPSYNENRNLSPFPPPEYNGPVYQQINAAGAMYQNPEATSSQPMPNIYVGIPVDQSRNISPYQFDDLQIEAMPEYRLQNTFQPAPIDRSADPTWTARTTNDAFNVDSMRNSLPHCSTSTDDMFNVGGDRRAVGAQRLVGSRPSFLSNRAYDKELEEELQELERRIDTEFEYTD